MERLIEEVKAQVIAKAKKENRRDFDNLFREVMNNRMAFYKTFNENFDLARMLRKPEGDYIVGTDVMKKLEVING